MDSQQTKRTPQSEKRSTLQVLDALLLHHDRANQRTIRLAEQIQSGEISALEAMERIANDPVIEWRFEWYEEPRTTRQRKPANFGVEMCLIITANRYNVNYEWFKMIRRGVSSWELHDGSTIPLSGGKHLQKWVAKAKAGHILKMSRFGVS